jgi:acetylornithine/N-succinyldiaminopimelate aminotransferase
MPILEQSKLEQTKLEQTRLAQSKLEQTKAAEAKLLLQTYERNPILFMRGEGVHIIDENGERYLDLLSGIGVNALGYGHAAIERALINQGRALIHTSNLYYHEGQAELALRLTERTGPEHSRLDRAFFSNTGAEAVEGALKLARAHAGLLREEGRTIGTKVLALEGSFHGRTYGAVSATHKAKYREPFGPVVPGFEFVRFNDVADLCDKFSTDVCAILVEAIQGEGGIRPLSQEFFDEARKLASSTGALLIVDEIQAGMGRTGKWFAYQHYGIQPDITTLAKPLAGGIPLGAILCTEEVARAIHPGMHGTTFGGGPLACAVAIAVIDAIEQEKLLAQATEVGGYFTEQLLALAKKHPVITEVRGKGLMIGLEIGAELDSAELAKLIVAEMLKRRILINCTSETVLRFLPPFILEHAHVDTAIAALDEIFTEHAATFSGAAAAAEAAGGQRV